MVQVTEFIDAFEYKYPGYQVAILFDCSTTHHKMADDASHVKKFGVDPGFQKFGTGPKKGENKPYRERRFSAFYFFHSEAGEV